MNKFIEINQNESINTVGGGVLLGTGLVLGGIAAGLVGDEVVERKTGKDTIAHIGDGLEYVGDGLKWFGNKLSK